MAQDQAEDAVAVHELAVGVHRAHPVRVAVYGHADIGLEVQHGLLERLQVLDDRLRVDAAEDGVALAADLGHVRARAAQDLGQVAAAAAVHRVGDDLEPGLGDQVQIHHAAQGVKVGRAEVALFHLGGGIGGHVHRRFPGVQQGVQFLLHLGDHAGDGRAAETHLDFEAVELRRVVRRRDHDAALGVGLWQLSETEGEEQDPARVWPASPPPPRLWRPPRRSIRTESGCRSRQTPSAHPARRHAESSSSRPAPRAGRWPR